MRRLRICRVTHAIYPDVIGGHAIFCHELSARQTRTGHLIEVLTTMRDKLPKHQWTEQGYHVTRFDKVWMPWDSLGMSNPLLPSIYTSARGLKHDLIDAHSPLFLATALAVKAAIDTRKPVVTTVHGVLALRDWLANLSQKAYLRSVGTWTLRNSSRVICLTKSGAAEVVRLGVRQQKVRIIPIAVDPALFKPRAKRPTVMWIGRLVPEKGLDTLIDAVAKVQKKYRFHVIVVGDGPLRNQLIRRARTIGISNRVTFVASADRAKVAKFLGESLIFALPSLKEGLPSTLLEAMASSNAVVASDLPELREVLGDVGSYFSPNDPEMLAHILEEALGDPALCRRKGREARAIVRSRFTWKVVLPLLEELYEEVVAGY